MKKAQNSKNPLTFLVLGAGSRGNSYSNFALARPDLAKVVAVAEPHDGRRDTLADAHGVAPENRFPGWREAAKAGRIADAVAICTMDALHEDCVMAFARQGYHILLEKPIAPTAPACRRIVDEVRKYGKTFAVCHVLRYTPFTRAVKKVVDSGALGDIVSVEHLEPVGFWHQAHSFVRGNWRNTAESSFMLLQKSCHDMDWLSFIIGRKCLRVASFGGLYFFNAAHQPKGAADRCLDCPLSKKCAYSAKEFYFDKLRKGETCWPLSVVDPTLKYTKATVTKALREGPYGRCVFKCDNDVVDHQVVSLEYEGGVTASFSMNAFNDGCGRKTRIFGTKGSLETSDSSTIRVFDFLSGKTTTIDTNATAGTVAGGHGGGDGGIMEAFCRAILENRPELIVSGADATIESHLVTFAAEKARLTGKVVEMAKFK
ncbi:MAG: Gfo/Idh/MocA family oxidoreductase [Kiritimatiellae bacterium]|nr:Gfo/Idh/MocA family oxidoreductase [Kiritimatiellia bacterium]